MDQVPYNERTNELFIAGDALYAYDVGSALCTTMPRRFGQLHMELTPKNQLLVSAFGQLAQMDRQA